MIRYNHLVLQERIKFVSFHISANCCTIRQDLEQMIAILWVCKLNLWFKCSTVTDYNYRLLGSELEGETEKKKWKKFHCSLSPSKCVISSFSKWQWKKCSNCSHCSSCWDSQDWKAFHLEVHGLLCIINCFCSIIEVFVGAICHQLVPWINKIAFVHHTEKENICKKGLTKIL